MQTPSRNPALRSPYLVPALFSAEECQKIVAAVVAETVVVDPYSVQYGEPGSTGDRRLLRAPEVMEWVIKRLMQAAFPVNQAYFRFDITGIEVPHVISYAPGQQSHWHMDITDDQTTNRKLSMVVFLNQQPVFSGGRFSAYPESLEIDQAQGNLLLFPAFLLHRVAPILSGTRYSLATWGIGPPFR